MILRKRLDCIVANWKLLGNPFFEALRNGELPIETIQLFAKDFGHVIKLVPKGWETIGDTERMQESQVHIVMWDCFCKSLNTWATSEPKLPENVTLAESCKRVFSSKFTALGGLYAIDLLFDGCAAGIKARPLPSYRSLYQALTLTS